jgi:MFS family permease
VVSLVYGPINGQILARWGSRPCLVTAGIAFIIAGVILTTVSLTTPAWLLLIAYGLLGLGNVAVGGPISHTAAAGMPRAQAGLAAGVSSATRQVGATLGVAIASVTLGAYAVSSGHGAAIAAATHTGWWLTVGYGALVLVLGMLITTRWALGTAAAAVEAPAESGTGTAPVAART